MPRAFVILCLLISTTANADIHVWTDENGKKHFSDKPPKHLTSKTINYDAIMPSEERVQEARRLSEQQRKHADSLKYRRTATRLSTENEDGYSWAAEQEKAKKAEKSKGHMTRNEKFQERKRKKERCKIYSSCWTKDGKKCLVDVYQPPQPEDC